jgi:hypothetical protein
MSEKKLVRRVSKADAKIDKVEKPTIHQTSPKARRKKDITNTYEIEQFKKLVGKNAIQLSKGFAVKLDLKMREKILSGSVTTIAMTGYVKNGVVYIYNGVERYVAVNSISYAELKKLKKEIYIVINQTNQIN